MKSRSTRMLLLTLAIAGPAAAQEAPRPGAYEVRYKLELPHLETNGEETATICLSGVRDGAALPVLSANNPLARCPARDVRRAGDQLEFAIVCPGGNAARASARFDLRADGFQGRIVMNMGGKNMTMTETQSGRRVGDCPATDPISR